MQIIFSNRAYLSVISETSEKIKTETGGVFLGRYENETWYIIEAIDPGPKSVFQAAYFEYDQKYTEHLINKIARLYKAKLSLIGLWHRHPGSFDEFSSTDDGTNSDYARLSANGAISVLVNIDPRFRMTAYHVAWPLKYSKITYKTGDDLIPEQLLQMKDVELSLDYINSYADKSFSGKNRSEKPQADFAHLLGGIKTRFERIILSKEDYMSEETEEDRNSLIDSLLNDISYFSENRGLALNIEQNKGILFVSHKGLNNTITRICFRYIAHKKQIVFSYDDVWYLYTSGLFADLLADSKPADTAFKSGLMRVFGLSKENQEE